MGEYNRELIQNHYSVRAMADDYEAAYAKLGAKNVIVSGYYGYKNMGDDCLLSVIIDKLENENVIVLSRTPRETRLEYGVHSIGRFNWWQIKKNMFRGGLLINGGGSILQDVTSTKSIMYYLLIIKMARWFNMKVMVYANGIGPVNSPVNRRRVRKVLDKVDVITLRERQSLDELREMGVKNERVEITADPAFTLEPCDNERVDELLKDSSVDGDFFAIAIRPWKDDISAIVEVAKKVQEKHGLTPLFLVMQPLKDEKITQEFCEQVKGSKILKNATNAMEMLGVLCRAKFLIGMRLHSIIYSASVGTPFIGFSYDPKIDSIASELGDNVFLHNVSDINPQDVLKDVDYIVNNRKEISQELTAKVAEMREKTKRDTELVMKLLGKKSTGKMLEAPEKTKQEAELVEELLV
jgi:polysaccharide pyruvyl transferase CsaB